MEEIKNDAMEIVRKALISSSKESESMGLNVVQNTMGDSAIQLNKSGGWGDGRKPKKRTHVSPVSQIAKVLKG